MGESLLGITCLIAPLRFHPLVVRRHASVTLSTNRSTT